MTTQAPKLARVQMGERWLDGDALHAAARRFAGWLEGLGLGAGSRVALILRNDFAYFIAHEAARYCGVDIVPVNWHLAAPEIGYVLDDCDARIVVIHADLATPAIRAVAGARRLLVVRTPAEVVRSYGLDPSVAAPEPDDDDFDRALAEASPSQSERGAPRPPLFYTSGTTGRPKAVVREAVAPEIGAALLRRAQSAWGLNQAAVRTIMTGPLYHSAPNGYAYQVCTGGDLLVLPPRFDAAELLLLIERHRITHLHLVPTMFARLLQLPAAVRAGSDLSSLEYVTHGAAPCPPEVKRAMIAWWGPVIFEYYAMTETGIITTSTSTEWLSHPGSVGRAAPGVTLRIRTPQGGECGVGEPGLICVRHEATAGVRYHNAPDKTSALHQGGFVVTGDIGHLDADGFLYLTDRATDLVISGGVNIYPAEVEAALAGMPDVRDCAVFGVPHPELGEQVAVALETDRALDAASVRAYLGGRVGAYKIPRVVHCLARLPREDSGKIRKRELRAALSAAVAPRNGMAGDQP